MKIHRQHAIAARSHKQVGHQLGSDRHTRLIFSILSRIPIKWNHCRDAHCARPTERVHHDEQLHQIMIGRRTGGLHHIHILAPDIFVDLHERLAVRKRVDGAFPQLDANTLADGLREFLIGCAGKYFHKMKRFWKTTPLLSRAGVLWSSRKLR